MLSLETERDGDSDSSDDDVSIADMLARLAQEKEPKTNTLRRTNRMLDFSPMAMGATTMRTSQQKTTANKKLLLHPPITMQKCQRQLRMQGRSVSALLQSAALRC